MTPNALIKSLSLLITFSCLFFNSRLKGEEAHFRTATIKLTSKIAIDSTPSETAQVMAGAGIDFPVLLQQAVNGSEPAVKLLLWTSSNVGLDGAAADGFGYYLLEIAKKIGDAKFSKVLSSIKNPETLETIRLFLLDELGFFAPENGSRKKATIRVKKLLPKTWVYLKPIGKQDAAGNPLPAE